MVNAMRRRALTLGLELDGLNRVRANRQALLTYAPYMADHPVWLAGFLMGTADIDQRRRELRDQIGSALTLGHLVDKFSAEYAGQHRRRSVRQAGCTCILVQPGGTGPWAIGIPDPRCDVHGSDD